jgi:hypothetical protein
MRPAFRKPKLPEKKATRPKAPDDSKALIKMRHWVQQALAEIKTARGYLAKQYAGPENECIEWAQKFLENALTGKEGGK